ncbi:MAG: protein-tyrosine phosphatase, partial [Actinomycetota bacterium]|nr:protein-tyrosine phosphatase [Actinomycetota bacterium]
LAQARQGGVLFHCLAGRDRTGMISMVLLSLAGVRPEAIVDGLLSEAGVDDGTRHSLRTWRGRLPSPTCPCR